MSVRPKTSPRSGPLTWRQCANIVMVFMALGIALALLRPVWLTPPQFVMTPIVYLVIAMSWLPALVFCALRRPAGPRRIPVLLATVGVIASVLWCTLGASSAGMALLITGRVDCTQEMLPQAQVRYTCANNFTYYADVYVFEGPQGSPFVRLVEMRTVQY
jgi:hypothetical protein